jgi:hypothetical protein
MMRFKANGNDLLDKTVVSVEICHHHHKPESKKSSMQGKSLLSPKGKNIHSSNISWQVGAQYSVTRNPNLWTVRPGVSINATQCTYNLEHLYTMINTKHPGKLTWQCTPSNGQHCPCHTTVKAK